MIVCRMFGCICSRPINASSRRPRDVPPLHPKMRRNNVRGPTSALTEFLRESGINHAFISRRGRQPQQQQAEAGPSNASASVLQEPVDDGEQDAGQSAPAGDVDPDSDHLDSEDEAPTKRKRKAPKAAFEKRKKRYQSLSGQTSRATPNHLSEALRSVPNARSNSL
ncbi:hypothetical protein F5148DRAFT_220433 [Russula earlei]|uniref:Uncharacterized protein n=1 Tax=Russula earlei TaxID=71964 RepID=A0ACC0U506_9AGAM|nr:hypothetical protein F5148DRAFT_220433 [Russula earlei]